MKIAIPREISDNETRVAISPDAIKKYSSFGLDVVVEAGAGWLSGMRDEDLTAAGATIAANADEVYDNADIILKIKAPQQSEVQKIKEGAIVIASLNALTDSDAVNRLKDKKITAFAMELMPRITRAQSMDILSSQSNLAGYKAVLDGAAEFGSAFPMMMTAAGTIPPAKVFIMGAGVAGLQAIATAKRLGAVVTAYDVRPATKEQVESLGGKFVVVDEEAMKDAETSGGYAKEMSEEYKKKEQEVLQSHIAKQDMVITTALIPGKKAPILVKDEALQQMKPGAVLVDLAVEAGGNVEGAEAGKVVEKHGVKIVGHLNVAGRLPNDASALFAKNILNFVTPHIHEGKLEFDFEDETVTGTCVTKDGQIARELPWHSLAEPAQQEEPAEEAAVKEEKPTITVKSKSTKEDKKEDANG
ncbi:MAG: Re/Si-specific NAD(P)(+) transhydrogenase subunit alpha [Alphaproteobacteria bacterium]